MSTPLRADLLAELGGFALLFGLFSVVAHRNRLVLLSARASDRAIVAVVKTLPLAQGGFVRIIECQDVSAREHSQEGR